MPLPTDSSKYRAGTAPLLAGASYALLLLILAWPALAAGPNRLLGNNIDSWIFYWDDWWFRQVVDHGRPLFYTDYLFYPQGTSLVTHSTAPVNSLLAYPLAQIVSPVLAYNASLLFGLWIGGLGLFALSRALSMRPVSAFFAGLIFILAPYHLTQALAHGHLGSIHWWPWTAWGLHRLTEPGQSPRRRAIGALAAAVSFALTAWTGLQIALLLALWCIVYLGFRLRGQPIFTRDFLRPLATAAGLAALLCAPLLAALLRDLPQVLQASADFADSLSDQTDLLAYLIPPHYHPLWGSRFLPVYDLFIANRAFVPTIGLAGLAFVAAAFRSRSPEKSFWLGSAFLWLLLALGPVLRVAGELIPGVPLPYRLINGWSLFSALRSPDRFNLLLAFSLAVLCGLGLDRLLSSRSHRVSGPLAAGFLAVLLVVEYAIWPLPTHELPAASPIFTALREYGDGGVIDYPLGYSASKFWLYYQTIHERPIVEGHLSRYSEETYRVIAENPLLAALYNQNDRPRYLPDDTLLPQNEIPLGPALRDLRAQGLRFLVHHRRPPIPPADDALSRLLPFLPEIQDASAALYDLEAPLILSDPSLATTTAPRLLRAEAGLAESGGPNPELTLTLLAQPGLDPPADAACDLQLLAAGAPIRTASVRLWPDPAGWQAADLTYTGGRLSLPVPPAAGRYDLALDCPGQRPVILPDRLHALPEGYFLARPGASVEFRGGIHLLGSHWQVEQTRLILGLTWTARSPVERDFKVFLHLLDEQNQIAAQYDAQPCSWQCPTSTWQPGALIQDTGVLDLANLPRGRYRLAVGLYDEATGVRLAAVPNTPNNAFIFPDAIDLESLPSGQPAAVESTR